MRLRIVLLINAGLMLSVGLSLLVPLAISLLYADGSWDSFLYPSLGLTLVGGAGFWGFFCAWILVFAVATFLVAIQKNLTLVSAAAAVAATLKVIGPGLGQVGATENYQAVNYFGRVVLIFCMLFGRLEILTVLSVLTPEFWRRR